MAITRRRFAAPLPSLDAEPVSPTCTFGDIGSLLRLPTLNSHPNKSRSLYHIWSQVDRGDCDGQRAGGDRQRSEELMGSYRFGTKDEPFGLAMK